MDDDDLDNDVDGRRQARQASDDMRIWEIKISQIEYHSPTNPPTGCLQYLWGYSGRFETFNFAHEDSHHLINQHYSICLREEEGMCCVTYQTCREKGAFSPSRLDRDCEGGGKDRRKGKFVQT